ncbi:protein FAM149B1 isoform X2 [Poecilia latipinna]|uniref:protein FAM149B1-like isoform X2 n=1 Tax=Poecilia latipinna TaxID=48699 RepID=UPI00072DDE5E|nr:PREDICTED: protein FAM149B1-like isoform X2 [Poecilia latipinna]XP_014913954.1 PREDICTED: protein FAM149B1-like isoform X2 [Poecilia latipinna]
MLFAESRARGGGDERRGLEPLNRREKRMISRYNRRPVSHKLEIRGLSRSSLDHHPLPEEADDIETSPHYLHDLQEAVSAHNSSQTSAASDHSDCPTVISVSPSQSWSGIHSSTGTGISTERSSVFSWGYDEFDKAASRQVQQMFDEIDKELYEGRGCGGGILQGLQDECQQWTTRFPHLRIVGTQLLCPTDEGFQWYATPGTVSLASSPSTDRKTTVKSQGKEKGAAELNVQGRKAALIKECDGPPNSEPSSYDQPRVIEVEGVMEEYLAFDSRDLNECHEECPESVRRHHCLPPVSPYCCRRQAVLDLLFDDVWRELVGWMKELVQRHWECCTSHDETLSGSLSPVQPDALNPFMLLSSLPAALPKPGQSRVPPLTSGQQLQGVPISSERSVLEANTKSRGSKHKSRWKSKKQKRPSAAGRTPAGAAATQHNLNDLIVIHSIPLQQRNLSVLERSQDPEERPSHRPVSSAIPSSRPRPRRALEQSSSSLSRQLQSARRRNPPPRNLLPLVPSLSQAGTGGYLDEVIRGTRLTTASDRLTSPLVALSRNTPLPPIGTGDGESSHPGLLSKLTQRQKGPSSRAHSALHDEAQSSVPRDRHHILDVFSRPNTTHTYRSDTPYRSSFTVLDNIGQGRPGRASVGTDSLGIGVTGVGLGISSSSFLDSYPHHLLGPSPIKDEEEPEPQSPVAAAPVPSRSYTRSGISSRSSRPGL